MKIDGEDFLIPNYAKLADDYAYFSETKLPTWLEFGKYFLFEFFVWTLIGVVFYLAFWFIGLFGVNIPDLLIDFVNKLISFISGNKIASVPSFISGKKIAFVFAYVDYFIKEIHDFYILVSYKIFNYKKGLNSMLELDGITLDISKIANLVYIVRSNLINIDAKGTKVFNAIIDSESEYNNFDLLVDNILHRYFTSNKSLESKYTNEFNRVYNKVKFDIDKYFKN